MVEQRDDESGMELGVGDVGLQSQIEDTLRVLATDRARGLKVLRLMAFRPEDASRASAPEPAVAEAIAEAATTWTPERQLEQLERLLRREGRKARVQAVGGEVRLGRSLVGSFVYDPKGGLWRALGPSYRWASRVPGPRGFQQLWEGLEEAFSQCDFASIEAILEGWALDAPRDFFVERWGRVRGAPAGTAYQPPRGIQESLRELDVLSVWPEAMPERGGLESLQGAELYAVLERHEHAFLEAIRAVHVRHLREGKEGAGHLVSCLEKGERRVALRHLERMFPESTTGRREELLDDLEARWSSQPTGFAAWWEMVFQRMELGAEIANIPLFLRLWMMADRAGGTRALSCVGGAAYAGAIQLDGPGVFRHQQRLLRWMHTTEPLYAVSTRAAAPQLSEARSWCWSEGAWRHLGYMATIPTYERGAEPPSFDDTPEGLERWVRRVATLHLRDERDPELERRLEEAIPAQPEAIFTRDFGREGRTLGSIYRSENIDGWQGQRAVSALHAKALEPDARFEISPVEGPHTTTLQRLVLDATRSSAPKAWQVAVTWPAEGGAHRTELLWPWIVEEGRWCFLGCAEDAHFDEAFDDALDAPEDIWRDKLPSFDDALEGLEALARHVIEVVAREDLGQLFVLADRLVGDDSDVEEMEERLADWSGAVEAVSLGEGRAALKMARRGQIELHGVFTHADGAWRWTPGIPDEGGEPEWSLSFETAKLLSEAVERVR